MIQSLKSLSIFQQMINIIDLIKDATGIDTILKFSNYLIKKIQYDKLFVTHKLRAHWLMIYGG